MERDVRYCTTEDGIRIAYCVTGAGPPLLACPYFIESFGLDHMMPPFKHFMRSLELNARLIRFDTRGTGLSDREVTDFSLEALICDIDAVVTAAGVDSVDVWAPIGSVMRAIGYAVERPQRVRSLVLYEAHESGSDVFRPEAARGLAGLARSDWRTAAHSIARSAYTPRELADGIYMVGEWNRKSIDGAAFAAFLLAMSETSVAGILDRVAVPTFILHHGRDRVVKIDIAQRVASQIAGSRMRVLSGIGPFFAAEETSRDTAEALEDFLHGGSSRTDFLGHKEVMQRLGEDAGGHVELTRRELEVLRRIVAGQSGREIAAELVLSPRTVERHVANIYHKTNTHGRAQLAGFALRRNLV